MSTSIVIDQISNIRYVIDYANPDVELGRGALGVVYRAYPENAPSGTPVAVKVPIPGADEADLKAFFLEGEILQKLSQTPVRSHVIWCHPGLFSESNLDRQSPVLVMELMNAKYRLSNYLKENRLHEKFGLQVMLHYTHLLVSLHGLGYTVRGDRKDGDFYWREENLVILDWNRAKKIPGFLRPEEVNRLQRADLQAFGFLITRLLLGKMLLILPDPDDVSRSDWMELSRGTRRILFRLCSSQTTYQYPTAEVLYNAILQQTNYWSLASSDPKALVKKAENKRIEAEKILNTPESIEIAEEVFDICTLLEETSLTHETIREVHVIGDWARSLLLSERSGVQEIIEETVRLTKEANYSDALALIDHYLEQLDHTKLRDLRTSMRIRRWRAISELGAKLVAAGHYVEKVITRSISIIHKLEDLSLSNVERPHEIADQVLKELESARFNAPEGYFDHFFLIVKEIYIRKAWWDGRAAEERGLSQEANEFFHEAYSQWRSLNKTDSLYAQAVLSTLTEMNEWIQSQALREARSEWAGQSKDDFQKAYEKLHTQVCSILMEPRLPLEDIKENLIEAIQKYDASVIIGAEKEKEVKSKYAKLLALEQIQILQDQGNALDLLERGLDFESLDDFSLMRAVLYRCFLFSKPLIQNFVWPEDIAKASCTLQRIKALDSLEKPIFSSNVDVKSFANEIERKSVIQQSLMSKLPINPMDNIDDQELDNTLQSAIDLNIELFNSPGLILDDDRTLRTGNVYALRLSRRLESNLITLNQDLQNLTIQLPLHLNSLSDLRDELENTFEKNVVLSTHTLPKINQLLSSLEVRLLEINEFDHRWEFLQPSIASIEERIQNLAGLSNKTDNLINEIHDMVDELSDSETILFHQNTLQNADRFSAILLAPHIVRGLSFAQDFKLSEAQQELEYIQKSQHYQTINKIDIDLLKDACNWLSKVTDQPGLLDYILDWRHAVEQNDKLQAKKTYEIANNLARSAGVNLYHWLLAEIRFAYIEFQEERINTQLVQSTIIESFETQAWHCLERGAILGEYSLEALIKKAQASPFTNGERQMLAEWVERLHLARMYLQEVKLVDSSLQSIQDLGSQNLKMRTNYLGIIYQRMVYIIQNIPSVLIYAIWKDFEVAWAKLNRMMAIDSLEIQSSDEHFRHAKEKYTNGKWLVSELHSSTRLINSEA